MITDDEIESVISATKQWLSTVVVGLNLCPFAKHEMLKDSLHFSVSQTSSEEKLLIDLQYQLSLINNNELIESALLIHPNVLQDFTEYNQFLDYVDALLTEMSLDGVFQVASFHPDYCFDDTQINDTRNYSNKSPFAMLHILREESVSRAVDIYPHINEIPTINQVTLSNIGKEKLDALRKACFKIN